jgi:3-oxoacyl-[acyl-carrier protein] reductase
MDWWEKRAGLRDTVVVVTGGAGGLGEAVSLDLVANGVKVALVDRDVAAVENIRAALEASGADAITHVGDARDRAVLETLFAASNERWARLDGLVNVVGGTFRAPFTDTNERGWDALIRTNLDHVLHACSIAIPLIRVGGRGGSIVNLTTVEAHRAAPNFAVYSAAKAAVAHFARSLAIELAPVHKSLSQWAALVSLPTYRARWSFCFRIWPPTSPEAPCIPTAVPLARRVGSIGLGRVLAIPSRLHSC